MNEEFVKRVYDTVIIEHISIYKDLFENTKVQDSTVDYWKDVMKFYNELDDSKKAVFYNILKQVLTDAVSEIFGIIDGSSTLKGGNLQIRMQIEGEDTEEELQDTFLVHVEEQSN